MNIFGLLWLRSSCSAFQIHSHPAGLPLHKESKKCSREISSSFVLSVNPLLGLTLKDRSNERAGGLVEMRISSRGSSQVPREAIHTLAPLAGLQAKLHTVLGGVSVSMSSHWARHIRDNPRVSGQPRPPSPAPEATQSPIQRDRSWESGKGFREPVSLMQPPPECSEPGVSWNIQTGQNTVLSLVRHCRKARPPGSSFTALHMLLWPHCHMPLNPQTPHWAL